MTTSTRWSRLLPLLICSCATTQTATHVETRIDPQTYRSPEGFQAAKWGMTPTELTAFLTGAEAIDPATYRRHESVEGRAATVTYSFSGGHLSGVTVQYDPPAGAPGDFDGLYAALHQQFGDPVPPPGQEDANKDAAIALAALLAAVVVIGVIVAIASHGHGSAPAVKAGGAVHAATAIGVAAPRGVIHPASHALWVDFAALRAASDVAEIAVVANDPSLHPLAEPAPQGGWMSEWKTPSTDVVLLGVNLGQGDGRIVLSFRSVLLAGVPADAQTPANHS